MELGANRVWDYVGDNFVHRLVQTDSCDSKFVEAGENREMRPGRAEVPLGEDGKPLVEGKTVDGIPVDHDEKMDSIQLEYTYLLTSQLEAQRRYFEEKIARVEQEAHREIEEVMTRARTSVEESKVMEERLKSLTKEKTKMDTKLTGISSKMSKVLSELNEEKQMNESLRRNQSEWQKKVDKFEKEVKELKESKDKEVTDLQVRELDSHYSSALSSRWSFHIFRNKFVI